MPVDWTREELREILYLCSYVLQTGLNIDVVWPNEESYQNHLQQVERVRTISQKVVSLLSQEEKQ